MNFQNSSTFKKIILKNDSQTNKLILHVTECVSNKEYGTGSWIFAFCVWIMFFFTNGISTDLLQVAWERRSQL
jgi:hypothetical protein